MIFQTMDIEGVFAIEPEAIADERGFFARTWCREEFAAHGIDMALDQCSVSFNRHKRTLRGLHYQAETHPEAKLVRCTAGRLFDVVVDLRAGSATRGAWLGRTLSAENRSMLYIPAGCAHGFQTLADDTEISYQMAGAYRADAQRGILWDDPTLAIDWPLADPILSERDARLPLLPELVSAA